MCPVEIPSRGFRGLAGGSYSETSLDHTWDEEKATLEVSGVAASSRADDLASELLQAKSYIHPALEMEYGREGNELREPERDFRYFQTELVEKEESLRVATIEVGT